MEINVIPVPNTSLWALVVDGETWGEGTYEEIDDRARELRCAFDAFGRCEVDDGYDSDLERMLDDDYDEIYGWGGMI